MNLKFLGTGGVLGLPIWNCDCEVCQSKNPKDKRLRPSLLVQINGKNILIDFGPDLRTQLLKYKIRKLDYALLTHAHGDHMNGYAELSRQKELILEAPAPVMKEFFERLGSSKKWLKTRNPSIKINNFKKKTLCNVEIDSVELEHKKDYGGHIDCCGYVFKSKNFSFAYLSDYSKIVEKEKVKNLDLIISDGAGFEKSKTGHMGVKGSIEIYKELKPQRMILTHLKHDKTHKFLTEYIKKFGNIEIGYDRMEIKANE
ncbi:MAG: MBL fold metallo-hydrolase [Candidatus Diapherotrites archaeon]|uniref:MBL fold metallo-hydrolase n=1 Tax=Candidatus Iainarchaeum sp. TaxID=3101447 RepID=A0A939C9S4_9ARCH|nr:MBL fold metallo-hydrolase [Candidatus Diapherotrites archaeon]